LNFFVDISSVPPSLLPPTRMSISSKVVAAITDLADHRGAPKYTVHRVSPTSNRIVDFERAAAELTKYLLRVWRVNKTANRDATYSTIRLLRTDDEDEDDVENELGTCMVITAVVSPEQGPIGDPRNWWANVILCLGQPAQDDRLEFAFSLSRGGRMALVESVIAHLTAEYDCVFSNVSVSPHSLAFLAREWTRIDYPEDKAPPEKYNELKLEFIMPKAVANDGLDQVTLTIARKQLEALHKLIVEKGEGDGNDPTPSLVRALSVYVSQNLNVQMAGASITNISTPVADLSSDGKIRFLYKYAIKRALVQLAAATQPSTATFKRAME